MVVKIRRSRNKRENDEADCEKAFRQNAFSGCVKQYRNECHEVDSINVPANRGKQLECSDKKKKRKTEDPPLLRHRPHGSCLRIGLATPVRKVNKATADEEDDVQRQRHRTGQMHVRHLYFGVRERPKQQFGQTFIGKRSVNRRFRVGSASEKLRICLDSTTEQPCGHEHSRRGQQNERQIFPIVPFQEKRHPDDGQRLCHAAQQSRRAQRKPGPFFRVQGQCQQRRDQDADVLAFKRALHRESHPQCEDDRVFLDSRHSQFRQTGIDDKQKKDQRSVVNKFPDRKSHGVIKARKRRPQQGGRRRIQPRTRVAFGGVLFPQSSDEPSRVPVVKGFPMVFGGAQAADVQGKKVAIPRQGPFFNFGANRRTGNSIPPFRRIEEFNACEKQADEDDRPFGSNEVKETVGVFHFNVFEDCRTFAQAKQQLRK